MSQQIHFVNETKPGTGLDSSQVRALRSHVRKINIERSYQKSTRRLENFRSLTINDFSDGGKNKGNKRKQSPQPDPTPSLEAVIEDLPLEECPTQGWPLVFNTGETPTRAFQFLWSPSAQCLPKQCNCFKHTPSRERPHSRDQSPSPAGSPVSVCKHPYSSRISEAIDLDESRVNLLLQSCAFQVAAEPLLSTSASAGDLLSLSLFPECLTNSAFLYALFYSILHIHNACKVTNESLYLKSRALECLRVDLYEDDPTVRALSIGTIVLLSCAAYHCCDFAESTAHSEGLYKLLEYHHTDDIRLRSEVIRTILWWNTAHATSPASSLIHRCRQHLLRTALISDQHRFSQPELQYLPNDYCRLPVGELPTLPLGFALHQELISDDVLLCIRTILVTQDSVVQARYDTTTIEEVQAGIEARLVFQEQCCQDLGPIAECCRIAVYIVNYMSNSQTWKSTFVPLRLAEKLLNYLERTKKTDKWVYRRDLLLWLALVGASTGRGRNCFATALARRYQGFIEAMRADVKNWTDLWNGPKVLHNTMKSFIYANEWVAERHIIPGWRGLERAVFLCGSDDVDIGVDAQALL